MKQKQKMNKKYQAKQIVADDGCDGRMTEWMDRWASRPTMEANETPFINLFCILVSFPHVVLFFVLSFFRLSNKWSTHNNDNCYEFLCVCMCVFVWSECRWMATTKVATASQQMSLGIWQLWGHCSFLFKIKKATVDEWGLRWPSGPPRVRIEIEDFCQGPRDQISVDF